MGPPALMKSQPRPLALRLRCCERPGETCRARRTTWPSAGLFLPMPITVSGNRRSCLISSAREMPKDGWVVVADRNGPAGETRRIAGHHRRIAPALVREDFARAGFELVSETETTRTGPVPAPVSGPERMTHRRA